MGSSGSIIAAIIGLVVMSAFVGSFFAGFAIAGRSRNRKGYVLRGILWSVLIFFGGIAALLALAFGACIMILSGMKF